MKCTQRLYLTKDRKAVVADGDKRAATLYAVPGDEIPESAVKLFGLVDGGLKASKQGGSGKEQKGGSDKEQKSGKDKSEGGEALADTSGEPA